MNQASSFAATGRKSDPIEEFVEYSILAGDYDGAARALENNREAQAAKTVKFV